MLCDLSILPGARWQKGDYDYDDGDSSSNILVSDASQAQCCSGLHGLLAPCNQQHLHYTAFVTCLFSNMPYGNSYFDYLHFAGACAALTLQHNAHGLYSMVIWVAAMTPCWLDHRLIKIKTNHIYQVRCAPFPAHLLAEPCRKCRRSASQISESQERHYVPSLGCLGLTTCITDW